MGGKNKKNKIEGEKEDGGGNGKNVTVVLKTDLHCEGCASKIVKCLRSFDDVETVSVDESAKITVVGKVDPAKLREKLEQKMNKKVELISPQQKKDKKSNANEDEKENAKDDGNNKKKKQDKQKDGKRKNAKDESKSEKPKTKEPPVTTAVFKVYLHCRGCIQKIHKIVSKTKGYEDMKIDKQKDMFTVTGAMDMKAIADVLKKHLKRDVEIVPPKKEEKKENGGGGGGEKGKGGCVKEKGGGGGGVKEKGGGGGGGAAGGGGDLMEGNLMHVGYPYPHQFVYGPGFVGDPQFHYYPYPVGSYNAPQMFSDENPNACNVM